MDKVQADREFTGSFSEFVAHLKRRANRHPCPEAMREGQRATAKHRDPEMRRLFAERAPREMGPANPDRALAYKVGQLHLLALREQARQPQGQRFDLRRFNNEVIEPGSLPLDVPGRRIGCGRSDKG